MAWIKKERPIYFRGGRSHFRFFFDELMYVIKNRKKKRSRWKIIKKLLLRTRSFRTIFKRKVFGDKRSRFEKFVENAEVLE